MYNERILQYEHETMGKEIRDLLYRYQGNIWLDSVGRSFDDREIYRIIVGNRTAEKKSRKVVKKKKKKDKRYRVSILQCETSDWEI